MKRNPTTALPGTNRIILPILVFFAAVIVLAQPLAAAESVRDGVLREMEIIRERFVAEILGSAPSEAAVRELTATIREDGSWPGIDYEDVSRTGFEHARHLNNMRTMSRAFTHPYSPLNGDSELKVAIHAALDFWTEHDFISENWWWNEMGTPGRLVDTLLLMDGELTDIQRSEGGEIAFRANLDGVGARPGGDLIQIAGIMGKRALFERNPEGFRKAVDAMTGEVRITTGRGLKPDLSLQHRSDRVTSTLTYGRGYASSFAGYAVKLKGTRFAFPRETRELLIDYYLDGIHKSMAHGRYPDPPQLNRGITRRSALRPEGAAVPEALAQVSTYRGEEIEELIAVRRGEKEPAFRFNKFFWSSEYHTHQRPVYFASVRMYSTRNHNVEIPYNQEGLRNHHLADGANFILRTGEEYRDIFPAYDWQKIPGTTVVQKPSLPSPDHIQQRGLTDFAGGVSDGLYGATAFDFVSPLDDLSAKKAWFFFDREFVALGAGIASGSGRPVATTLNQALLRGEVHAATEERTFLPDRGEQTLPDTRWVWHDDTAYLFPSPEEVHLRNDTAAGSWRDINRQSWASDATIEKDVFALWLDHGTNPRNAAYAYVVVPGIESGEIGEYAESSPVSVLANTPEIQGIAHRELDLLQIVFYEAGEIEAAPGLTIAADQPGLVMIEGTGGGIERITVADPSRENSSFSLRVSAPFEGEGDVWSARWDPVKNSSEIHVQLPVAEYAGQSRILETGSGE